MRLDRYKLDNEKFGEKEMEKHVHIIRAQLPLLYAQVIIYSYERIFTRRLTFKRAKRKHNIS